MGNSSEELIKQMYESQLKAQKEQLQNDHNAAVSDLDAQKQMNQKVTDTNLNRTAVEAQKGAVSDEEYYAAAGLTSGAKEQARMARENQLLSNLTAIRAAQQTADAESERQRGLLAREFDSAIRKAQAENDLQKAQALYEEAEKRDAALLKQQEAAANLMAQGGDYSRYGALYGLTDAEVNRLNALYAAQAAVTESDDGGEDEEESPGGEVPNDPGNGLLQAALLGALGQQPTEPTGKQPEDMGYQPGTNAKNIIKSLESMRGMMGSETGIANSIVTYATQGRITMDDAEYMLKYFGYDPKRYLTVPENEVNADNRVLVGDKYLTWSEILEGVNNGTILEEYDEGTGKYRYAYAPNKGSGGQPVINRNGKKNFATTQMNF